MKIYVTGATGTGKTSIARALIARGIPAIDMDELCHWENRESKEQAGWEPGREESWYAAHGWTCNVGGLEEFLSANEDAFAVGLSSNQDEYLPLFDKVFILQSKPDVIVDRINNRTDTEYGKHPNEQKRLLAWHQEFEKEMAAKGAIPIDADRHIDEVVADILSRTPLG